MVKSIDELNLNHRIGMREIRGGLYGQKIIRSFARSSLQLLKATKSLIGHEECVNSIAFNSTGNLVVSGSDDETLKLWNFNTRKCIDTLYGHSTNIFTAEFLPNKSDTQIISGGNDSDVRHFDLISRVSRVYAHHSKKVLKVSVNPCQPDTFLSCSSDGTVRMFDIRQKYDNTYTQPIPSTNINSDGVLPQMFGGGRSGERDSSNNLSSLMINFDPTPLRRSLRSGGFKMPKTTIFSVEYHPFDGYSFITSSSDGSVRLFDQRNIKEHSSNSYVNIYRNLHKPWPTINETTGCVFSKDGNEILATYLSDVIYLYDVKRNFCKELNLDYFKDNSVRKRRANHVNNNLNNARRKKQFLSEILDRVEESITERNQILNNNNNQNNQNNNSNNNNSFNSNDGNTDDIKTSSEIRTSISTSTSTTTTSTTTTTSQSSIESNGSSTSARRGISFDDALALEYAEDLLDRYYNDLIVDGVDSDDLNVDTSSSDDDDEENKEDDQEPKKKKLKKKRKIEEEFDEDEYEGYYEDSGDPFGSSNDDENLDNSDDDDDQGQDDYDMYDSDQDSDDDDSIMDDQDDEEVEEDFDKTNIPKTYLQRYDGHISAMTIKSCNFYGPNSEFVMTGSDDQNIFIWEKKTGKLVRVLEGHEQVVNCVVGHPTLPSLISSGLDNDIMVWEAEGDYPNHKELKKRSKQISQFVDQDNKSRRERHLDEGLNTSIPCSQQ